MAFQVRVHPHGPAAGVQGFGVGVLHHAGLENRWRTDGENDGENHGFRVMTMVKFVDD